MNGTKLHWVTGPWSGRLAMAARPRGGDWLGDELEGWRRERVDTVVSMLESAEEQELGLERERDTVTSMGMEFKSLPIEDRQVPKARSRLNLLVDELDAELESGRNIVLHCRQGVGRTGLLAACLFIHRGVDPAVAMERLSVARGVVVPETEEQRGWIEMYAGRMATAR